ncbi:hypothetical protein ABFU82_02565 [Nocardioides sp. WV_118_6]
MLNYLQNAAALIQAKLPVGTSVPDDADGLFLLYAVLMRAKGADVRAADVHDAWGAWMTQTDPEHDSLVPFDQLSSATQAEDSPFLIAIRRAAAESTTG